MLEAHIDFAIESAAVWLELDLELQAHDVATAGDRSERHADAVVIVLNEQGRRDFEDLPEDAELEVDTAGVADETVPPGVVARVVTKPTNFATSPREQAPLLETELVNVTSAPAARLATAIGEAEDKQAPTWGVIVTP